MSNICCIFAGGPEEGMPCLPVPQGAFVLCADSGLRLCERVGCTPDLVLGDFDSLHAVPTQYPYLTAPVEKDDTDTMLACRYALAHGYQNIRIYGAFGGRLDHTFANIQTLVFLRSQGAEGILIGTTDYAVVQGAGTKRYPKREGFTFSVFSLTPQTEGVTLRGTYYPLENAVLTNNFSIGVSNRIMGEYAEVTCTSGLLLIIGSKEV